MGVREDENLARNNAGRLLRQGTVMEQNLGTQADAGNWTKFQRRISTKRKAPQLLDGRATTRGGYRR